LRTSRTGRTATILAAVLALNFAGVFPASALASRPGERAARPSYADAQEAFSYGLDADGVLFVQRADGAKSRYLAVSTPHFKLQISKGDSTGEVEFLRLSRYETLTTFTAGGNSFGVRKLFAPRGGPGKRPDTLVSFELGDEKVSFKTQAGRGEGAAGPELERRLGRVLERLRGDAALRGLMDEATFFTSREVTSKVFPFLRVAYFDTTGFDCLKQSLSCLIAVAGYVGGISALIVACPETIGLSCVGVLLLHPVLGAYVAVQCADVINKCDVKKPSTENGDDLELLWF
jgi:hypothetical protein